MAVAGWAQALVPLAVLLICQAFAVPEGRSKAFCVGENVLLQLNQQKALHRSSPAQISVASVLLLASNVSKFQGDTATPAKSKSESALEVYADMHTNADSQAYLDSVVEAESSVSNKVVNTAEMKANIDAENESDTLTSPESSNVSQMEIEVARDVKVETVVHQSGDMLKRLHLRKIACAFCFAIGLLWTTCWMGAAVEERKLAAEFLEAQDQLVLDTQLASEAQSRCEQSAGARSIFVPEAELYQDNNLPRKAFALVDRSPPQGISGGQAGPQSALCVGVAPKSQLQKAPAGLLFGFASSCNNGLRCWVCSCRSRSGRASAPLSSAAGSSSAKPELPVIAKVARARHKPAPTVPESSGSKPRRAMK